MISNITGLIKGKISLNSLVGMGSNRHVADLEEFIINVSSERFTAEKQSRYESGLTEASKTAASKDMLMIFLSNI